MRPPFSNDLIILGVFAFALSSALLFLSTSSIQYFEYKLVAMVLGAAGMALMLFGVKSLIFRR